MGRSAISAEARLLYLAAAVSPSDSALRHALRDDLDWNELCAVARQERAAAIVLRHLARVDADIATAGYQNLRQLATGCAMRMLRLEQLLHQIIGALAHEKIDAILLKGAGLAYSAYASFADRPMGDLDVLVPNHQAAHAWSLLQKMGWVTTEERIESARFNSHHHLPRLIQGGGAFQVEIHTALLPGEHPFRFSMDDFFARTRQVTVKQEPIKVPSVMHQLWHACVHFAWSHRMEWGSWRTFRDTAAIIHTGGINWTEFVTFARDTRAATCCFWTLRLARRVVGAEVPASVLRSLCPPQPEFILARLERHLLASLLASADGCPSIELTRRLWEIAIAPRWSGHGAARPWHVSERWFRDVERTESDPRDSKRANDRLRKVREGAAYLLRVARLRPPGDLPFSNSQTVE